MIAVGFIGLGAMGAPMAERLARSGFPVLGFDPYTPEHPASAIARASSAAEAAERAEVLCVMVATPAQAEAALLGEEGTLASLQPGATVVLMATVGPDAVARFAAEATQRGIGFVDAPVSGGVARAGAGDLLIMASGEDTALRAAGPVLNALGSSVFRLGKAPGAAQRMKLVNQLLCGVHIAVAAEALAYAESLGIDRRTAFEVVSTGAAASFMLSDRGTRMVDREFATPKSAVDIFVKDLGLVLGATALDLPIAAAALERFETASARGGGRLDDSAVITTYEQNDESSSMSEEEG